MNSWTSYKFLESAANLKVAIRTALDRECSGNYAIEAATYLRQGRQFFEAAAAAPLEIRPLLVQYGVIAMGKATAASRWVRRPGAFAATHGLSDTSSAGARLNELKLKVGNHGSFQEYHDAMRTLDSVSYFGRNDDYRRKFLEWPAASSLAGKTVTFTDLFSRLPDQAELFEKTLHCNANVLRCQFMTSISNESGELTAFIPGHKTIDRAALSEIVTSLRQQHDFLNRWVVAHACCAYGDLRIKFAFIDEPVIGDTDEPALQWH